MRRRSSGHLRTCILSSRCRPPSQATRPFGDDPADDTPGQSLELVWVRDGRGPERKRKIDVSVIGTFKAQGSEFTGEINTITIQAKSIRIGSAKRTTDAGPSDCVYSGRAEIGAASSPATRKGTTTLIWSRGNRRAE